MPGATAGQTGARARSPDVQIVENTPKLQAVRHAKSKLLMVVFWEPGSVANVEVDRPCLVLLDEHHLAVANPKNEAMKVNVTVGVKSYAIELPAGAMAGSSVIRTLGH